MKILSRVGASALALLSCAPVMAQAVSLPTVTNQNGATVPTQGVVCVNLDGTACSFSGSGGGAVSDVYGNGTLDLTTVGNNFVAQITSGQNVAAWTLTGLTGSGATLIMESSNDKGVTWNNFYSSSGSTGLITNTWTQDASFAGNVAGRTRIRLRVLIAGTGTATVVVNRSVAQRQVSIDAPLPPGSNVVGGVNLAIAGTPLAFGPQPQAGSVPVTLSTDGVVGARSDGTWNGSDANVSLLSVMKYIATGPTASGTNTIGNVNLMDSGGNGGIRAAVPLDGAANGLVSLFSYARQSLYNGTSWDKARSLVATDSTAGLGVQAMASVPTSAAAQGIAPIPVQNATASLLKSVPSNLFGINVATSTAAGWVIAANLAAVPASGATLTAAQAAYCMAVPASAGHYVEFRTPLRGSAGWVLLFSTSCTTYTPVSPAPQLLVGEAQ